MPKAREMLGEDDPVYERLESAIKTYETAYESIKSFFDRGKTIEAFDIESIDNFPQHIFRIKNCVPSARTLTYRNAFPILIRYENGNSIAIKKPAGGTQTCHRSLSKRMRGEPSNRREGLSKTSPKRSARILMSHLKPSAFSSTKEKRKIGGKPANWPSIETGGGCSRCLIQSMLSFPASM